MPIRRPSRFGEVLRALRTREGLSQKLLADVAGMSERAISDLERGVAKTPRRDTAQRLAQALGLEGHEKDRFERASQRGQTVTSVASTSQQAMRTLPRDITSFTGRTAELERLAGAPAAAGIYTIHGMPGTGKTALAIHAAHQLAIWFPDGQLFLELRAHALGHQAAGPADALSGLLTMIGVPVAQVPESLDDRIRLWRDRLADRRLILVFDDAASSDQVKPLLASAAGSLVLITSRQMLTGLDDIHSINLGTLQPAEAIELLITLCDRQDLEPEDPALASTAELCGYLPLAVGMAASQLRDHHSWTPADLAADLAGARDRRELLDDENLAVAAAFELSYQGLPMDQRRLFRRLGLNPGKDIDAWAAAALDNSDLRSARRGLDGLHRRHLIDEPAPGRYQLHNLIREYASILAAADAPDEQDAATDRLLDFYLYTARRADRHLARRTASGVPTAITLPPAAAPELATLDEALAWMRIEMPNLIAAVHYANDYARPAHVVAITAAMSGFMRSRVHWDQALVLHEMAVKAAEQLGNRAAQGSALNDLGDLERAACDYDAAKITLVQATTLCQRIGDVAGEAAATYGLAAIAYLTSDYPATEAALTRALELYRDQRDQLGEARTLDVFGSLQHGTGDYAAAAASHNSALKLFHSIDHSIGQASCLNHLGVLQLSMGDHVAAVASQEQAIKLYRLVGDRLGPH
jgi:transcriptional regulator with XRE-family HTH domain/tetratricopeptide (TPR) repeat protein